MADGRLTEPLIADAEGLDFPFVDEAILKELRQLDDAESGWAGDAEHVEDEDVLRMKQLIREKPKDVIQVQNSVCPRGQAVPPEYCVPQGTAPCSSCTLCPIRLTAEACCCVLQYLEEEGVAKLGEFEVQASPRLEL